MSSLFLLSCNQQSLLKIRKDQHAIGSSTISYKYYYTQNQTKEMNLNPNQNIIELVHMMEVLEHQSQC
mgnify:CR=1 FL=1